MKIVNWEQTEENELRVTIEMQPGKRPPWNRCWTFWIGPQEKGRVAAGTCAALAGKEPDLRPDVHSARHGTAETDRPHGSVSAERPDRRASHSS